MLKKIRQLRSQRFAVLTYWFVRFGRQILCGLAGRAFLNIPSSF
jgi:hypothetical protein